MAIVPGLSAGSALRRAAVVLAAFWLGTTVGFPLEATAEQPADDLRGVLRYDPMTDTLVPVPADEIKIGHVYNHFSRRLNRRVWSYVQDNGRFWFAFGEGTIQEAWRLDIRAAREERWERLEQIDPDLAHVLQRRGQNRVFLRLDGNGEWVLAGSASMPVIFNAETGRRWEKHFDNYIPVSSGPGRYLWEVREGKFVPADHEPRAVHRGGGGTDGCPCG